MDTKYLSLVLPLLVGACHDRLAPGDSPTAPTQQAEQMRAPDPRRSDFDFAAGERRHAGMTAEERLAEQRLFERLAPAVAKPPAGIFVTSEALPDGIVALVLRNRVPGHSRLVVISANEPLQAAVLAGVMALAVDEQQTPVVSGERFIQVDRDGHLTDTDGSEVGQIRRADLDGTPSDFLPRTTRSAETELPGLGRGRYLRF